MPLAATGPILGIALANAAGSLDAPGIAAWALIGTSICLQLPALTVFVPTGGTPLIAAGPVIVGTGAFAMLPGAAMGPGLAVAAGSLDAAGLAKWTAVGQALTDWMTAQGQYNAGFIGFVNIAPAPGPVTGVGTLTFAESPGALLAVAAGSTDAAGIAAWTAIGAAIQLHVTANMQLAPTALTNPGTGGPVIGTATAS